MKDVIGSGGALPPGSHRVFIMSLVLPLLLRCCRRWRSASQKELKEEQDRH